MNEMLITEATTDYQLLDSGDGKKLERFGHVVLSRPDPQALWSPLLDITEWKKAEATFEQIGTKGTWTTTKEIPDDWNVVLGELTFNLKLLPSKHVGIFPEQMNNWHWLEQTVKGHTREDKKVSVLNLFGYTGGATLACAKGGAEVCHVDASQFAVDMAIQNRNSSGLTDAPIRFIVDDVRKFVEREIKRGNKYDIIVLDPPVYGKGVKKEVWKIERDLRPLLLRIAELLSDESIAVILNGYASGYSHLTYAELLNVIKKKKKGDIVSGELAIKETSGRLLPAGIFARWEK